MISTPGSRGANLRNATNIAIAVRPKPSDQACSVSIRVSTFQVSASRCSLWRVEIPSSPGSCDMAMISAAALMKPIKHRMRHEAQQQSRPCNAEPQLKQPGQERQQRHVRVELIRSCRHQRADAGRGQQRRHRHGPGREQQRRTEERAQDRRYDRRIEPVLRRDAGELRVRERLRNGDQRNGDARDKIGAHGLGRESRPIEERKQAAEEEGHERVSGRSASRGVGVRASGRMGY